MIGANLTIIKAWKNPETESWIGWAMCGLGGFLGALAVGKWDFILLVFPLYICLINSLMATIVLIRKKKNIVSV